MSLVAVGWSQGFFFAACGCTRGTGARRVEVVSRERQAAAGRTLERVALAKVVVVGLF